MVDNIMQDDMLHIRGQTRRSGESDSKRITSRCECHETIARRPADVSYEATSSNTTKLSTILKSHTTMRNIGR